MMCSELNLREGEMAVRPEIDEALCDGCGLCVVACHGDGIILEGGKARIVEAVVCDFCSVCEAVCPQYAVRCAYFIIGPDAD